MKGKMPTAPQHAIFIGTGMGGSLPRVLAGVCAKVTIAEGNVVPDAPHFKGGRQQRGLIRTASLRGFP
jgi:hypothetical protein